MYPRMSSCDYTYNYICDYNAHQYVHTWWPKNVICGIIWIFQNILPNIFFFNHLIEATELCHMAT
jgi:hypothetical protein